MTAFRQRLFSPITLSLGLVAVVFAVDLGLPLGVASAVPYSFAVLIALRSPVWWFAPAVAVLCWVLTGAKMVLFPDRGSTELWKVIANRVLAVFAIGMTTVLGLLRKQAERQRARAEEQSRHHLAQLAHMDRLRTISQLAAGLAHELNQPLGAVCLHADMALYRVNEQGPEDLRESLSEITTQAHRAAEILKSLRRMASGQTAARVPVDLNAVVRTVVEALAWETRRVGAEVRLELAPTLPHVLGDRTPLEQVVYNILQNALEAVAGGKDRRIVIQSGLEDDAVFVAVTDQGIGLPAESAKLFDEFYSTKPGGIGMGLAISRSIIESHGGTLTAAPASGGGAGFRFRLPSVSSSWT